MLSRLLRMMVPLSALVATGCSTVPTHAGFIAVDGESIAQSPAGLVVLHAPEGEKESAEGFSSDAGKVTSSLEGVNITCEAGCTAEPGRDYVTIGELTAAGEVVVVVSKPGYAPARVSFVPAKDGRQYERKVVVLQRPSQSEEQGGGAR